jgi:ribosomal protein S18 acetylase RimI-like enzyme
MRLPGTRLTVRTATTADRQRLANLIHFEIYVHRHLDWRAPLDWLGQTPYLIAEHGNQLSAALACPPDPPSVAWVRLFAASSSTSAERVWEIIWPKAKADLEAHPELTWVAAIPLSQWFETLIERSGFSLSHHVVMLSWESKTPLPPVPKTLASIRPMVNDDLTEVQKIDQAAFPEVWRNSRECLELAFRQAAIATVAMVDGNLVGYQISTATPMGGHLARLAVLPAEQGKGVGASLVYNLLTGFIQRGAQSVTVNTQQDNHASLKLYAKAGFHFTGEIYPVYQQHLEH